MQKKETMTKSDDTNKVDKAKQKLAKDRAAEREVEKTTKTKPNTFARVMEVKNTRYGAKTLISGKDYGVEDRQRIQSGIFMLTWCSGGGYPLWAVSKHVGPESGGKSSSLYDAMKVAGMMCWRCFNMLKFCTCSLPPLKMLTVLCNPEGDADQEWIQDIGVPQDSWSVSYGAPSGDAALDIAHSMMKADDCGLVGIDSLAMLVPESDLERPIGDPQPGAQARMLSHAHYKMQLTLNLERRRGHPIFVIVTNQLRSKIGVVFGSNETEVGGHAIQHWMSLGARTSKISTTGSVDGLSVDDPKTGARRMQRHKFLLKKNRMRIVDGEGEYVRAIAPILYYKPKKADTPPPPDESDAPEKGKLVYNRGAILDYNLVLKYGTSEGVITKVSAGYQCKDIFKVNTHNEIKTLFRKDPMVYYQVQKEICDAHRRKEQALCQR